LAQIARTCASVANSPRAAASFDAAIAARSSVESDTGGRHPRQQAEERHGRCRPERLTAGCELPEGPDLKVWSYAEEYAFSGAEWKEILKCKKPRNQRDL
jgi:hypothetical protein